MIFDLFSQKRTKTPDKSLKTDVHSHLIPGIDDGAKSIDESINLLKIFENLGFNKVITTPHVMQDYYPNTTSGIIKGLGELQTASEEQGLGIEITASAEYFLDEFLLEKSNDPSSLLLINDKFLLFEMSFMSESPFLKEFIFAMKSKGITPILAHAERYSYYQKKLESIEDLIERGCLIQMNSISLSGYYGKPVKNLANQLIEKELLHLLGSDCHNLSHLHALNDVQFLKTYQKALTLNLLNYSL